MNTLSIQKKKFPKNRKIRAVSLKPAYLNEDEETFQLVYVLSQGEEHSMRCTSEIFKRVNGREDRVGLDMQIDTDFILLVTKDKEGVELISGIHTLPKNTYRRGLYPSVLEGKVHVEIKINGTGEMDVVLIPPKTEKRVVESILGAIEGLTELSPGDRVLNKHEVVSASGNLVHIEVANSR